MISERPMEQNIESASQATSRYLNLRQLSRFPLATLFLATYIVSYILIIHSDVKNEIARTVRRIELHDDVVDVTSLLALDGAKLRCERLLV